jgi:SSS family transporter
LAVWVYIPVARRLKIPTANDYLERRFGLAARMLGFVSYSLNQMLGRMASILLLPALAISAIFGMEMQYSILIMGVVTTIFVTMGGLEAVIWTDVLQAIIMLVAVLVCFGFALVALDLGATDSMALLTNLDKLKMFDFRWDWQAPVVIVLFLNLFASVLGMIGDQNFIQRVQCTPSEKESRKMLYTALAVAIPMNFFLFALGTILFLFYATRAESLSPALKSDSIFPFFAAQNLPAGLAGFVVVALLAATISTVSSAMNSVANLGVEDIYRRFSKSATDQQCLKVGRILTLALGVFGTGSALLLANMSDLKSIWDLFIMITGMVLAPITGIFVLGIFTRRANNYGIWSGTITAILANCYVKYQMDLHPMVYIVVGVFSCVIIGYIVSLLTPKIEKNLEGLTVFSLLKK